MKAGQFLALPYVDVLEDNGVPGHVHLERNHFPVSRRHLLLENVERSSFIQPSQQANSEGHVFKQSAIDMSEPVRGAINPQLAAKRAKYRELAVGSVVPGVR